MRRFEGKGRAGEEWAEVKEGTSREKRAGIKMTVAITKALPYFVL